MLSLEKQNELRERLRQIHPEWRPATELYADLVRHHLRPDSRVLDLGCGRGGLVEQLVSPGALIVGVDPDWRSLREHRLGAHLPRVAAPSRQLPFVSGSFDVVVASWVLEHLARPAADFQEIGRVLRPGGVFVFITPNKRHPLVALNQLAGRLGGLQDRLVAWAYGRPGKDTFPVHYRANSAADIERLAETAQLRLTALHIVPDPTYLALAPALFRLSAWMDGRLPEGKKIHLVGCLERASRQAKPR